MSRCLFVSLSPEKVKLWRDDPGANAPAYSAKQSGGETDQMSDKAVEGFGRGSIRVKCDELILSAVQTGNIGCFWSELFGSIGVLETRLSENITTLTGTRLISSTVNCFS